MTEMTTLWGALVMSYPSAIGPADEPLTIEWPEGHSCAVVPSTAPQDRTNPSEPPWSASVDRIAQRSNCATISPRPKRP